jgi:hypothetical protein
MLSLVTLNKARVLFCVEMSLICSTSYVIYKAELVQELKPPKKGAYITLYRILI